MKWENRKKKWKINHEYRRVLTLDKIMGEILQEWKEKDMVSVKHGEWEEKETYLNDGDCEITEWQSARCSKCGKYHTTPYMYSFDNFNFCPNCGAKMAKENEE